MVRGRIIFAYFLKLIGLYTYELATRARACLTRSVSGKPLTMIALCFG